MLPDTVATLELDLDDFDRIAIWREHPTVYQHGPGNYPDTGYYVQAWQKGRLVIDGSCPRVTVNETRPAQMPYGFNLGVSL